MLQVGGLLDYLIIMYQWLYAGCCEHGNTSLVSIKYGKFEIGLCSIKLFSMVVMQHKMIYYDNARLTGKRGSGHNLLQVTILTFTRN
jgi:hypothetical protein